MTEIIYDENFEIRKYPQFKFELDPNASPSTEIKKLLNAIDVKHMEFFTKDLFDASDRFKVYKVHSVCLLANAYSILSNLEHVRPELNRFIDLYTNSDESRINKLFELRNCLYLIKEFVYIRNVKNSIFYTIDGHYTLNFEIMDPEHPEKRTQIETHIRFLEFSQEAFKQMDEHHLVREDFLKIAVDYIDLTFDKLQYSELEIDLIENNVDNEKKEKDILEVWLALAAGEYLKHIPKGKQSIYREQFFKIFNLKEKNYKTAHGNWIKNPKKGSVIKSLLDNVNQIEKERKLKSQKIV